MIQRVQSLYLLLAAFSAVVVPGLGSIGSMTEPGWLFPTLALLSVVIGTGSLATLFLFRRRALQRRLILVLQYATLLLLVAVFGSLLMTGRMSDLLGLDPGLIASMVLPIVSYVALRLARNGVERDIAEVESLSKFRLR